MTESTILHVTDPHLLADAEQRLHGWDVRVAFEYTLQAALTQYPDAEALVLGGDLVDDCSRNGYQWLNNELKHTGLPSLAIAGNHDDPARMAHALTSAAVHESLRINSCHLIGLCSHRFGRDDGCLGYKQLARLSRQLHADSSPTLLCIHHPPLMTGSRWLDDLGLVDAKALAATLAGHTHVLGILSGHVHQQAHGWLDSTPVWTTPATMRQFLPQSPEFSEDVNRLPGYRVMHIARDGTIRTSVHRVPMPVSAMPPCRSQHLD